MKQELSSSQFFPARAAPSAAESSGAKSFVARSEIALHVAAVGGRKRARQDFAGPANKVQWFDRAEAGRRLQPARRKEMSFENWRRRVIRDRQSSVPALPRRAH